MSRAPIKIPQLGELEIATLEHLWSDPGADVQQTHGAVGRRRGISANTVGSAVERLYRKGLLRREKVSHSYRYYPTIDRESFRAQCAVEAAGGLQALRRSGVLAAFVDLVGDADSAALAELERLVKAKRESGK